MNRLSNPALNFSPQNRPILNNDQQVEENVQENEPRFPDARGYPKGPVSKGGRPKVSAKRRGRFEPNISSVRIRLRQKTPQNQPSRQRARSQINNRPQINNSLPEIKDLFNVNILAITPDDPMLPQRCRSPDKPLAAQAARRRHSKQSNCFNFAQSII